MTACDIGNEERIKATLAKDKDPCERARFISEKHDASVTHQGTVYYFLLSGSFSLPI